MPFFSPQVRAGSLMSASRTVSVSAMHSDTTTVGHRRSASRTRSASGRLTTGLVERIQINLILPEATAWNSSTALRPGSLTILAAFQKRFTRSTSSGAKSMCAASWFASPPTSRPPMALGWPVMENGEAPGLPTRPVARWQLMMVLHLSVPVALWLMPWE